MWLCTHQEASLQSGIFILGQERCTQRSVSSPYAALISSPLQINAGLRRLYAISTPRRDVPVFLVKFGYFLQQFSQKQDYLFKLDFSTLTELLARIWQFVGNRTQKKIGGKFKKCQILNDVSKTGDATKMDMDLNSVKPILTSLIHSLSHPNSRAKCLGRAGD